VIPLAVRLLGRNRVDDSQLTQLCVEYKGFAEIGTAIDNLLIRGTTNVIAGLMLTCTDWTRKEWFKNC
jgi:hypothetical protein